MAVTIDAKKRDGTGTQSARRYRREGWIPGVFYLHGDDPVHLMFDHKKLYHFLHHAHGLVDLKVGGEKAARKCVVKEVQYDPLTEDVVHIDFLGVKMGEKIQVSVQLVMKGTPAGEKEGGILSQTIRELEIECMPQYIPESLEVDVSALDIGDAIHVSDLQYDNITILNEPEEMVVQIVVPKMYEELLEAEAAAAEAEEEEMEEPEVIGEEKPEAEEEAEEEQKQEKREE